ncbi:MAG: ABC transporter substrate-binding protein [Chloroflexi bacterium]|nr:ABC transporter substrate-binding protein [Chloroflexota bacterium]
MKRISLLVTLLVIAVVAAVSCAPAPTPAPVIVQQTVQVPVPQTVQVPVQQTVQVPVPQTVQVQVPVVVTATPAPTAAPKKGGTLIAARAADATGLDPHKQTAFASFRMLELIYDPLFAFDKDLKIVPNLAESWKWSEDGKTLTVTLRKNVKFHNGDPMTSDDVKFSFERILDEKTGAAARSSFTGIDKMDTPDANTIVFTLKAPNSAILSSMTNPNAAIINKKQVSGGADPAKVDVGTGAFTIDKWTPDQTFTMKASKDFWIPGLPRLDGIEWRTIPDESSILAGLRAKTLDWALINDPRVAIRAGAASSTLSISRASALAYHVLQLNAKRPVFTDLKVRQAISCAIDRQEVLDTASLGEGQVTAPATAPFYSANLNDLTCYKKDEAKAKQLLTEAGKATGVKFTIIAATGEPPTAVAEAQNIQAQLKKVGIETTIETLELSVYVDRWLKADFDAAVALNGGNPDPDVMFYRYWHSTGNLNNVAAYNSPEINALLDQGRAIADPEKRKPIYAEIQKKLTDAAPWTWLYVGYEYRVGQPFVKGFTPLSNGSLIYLREAWLDK